MDPTLQILLVAIVGGTGALFLGRVTGLPVIVPLLGLGLLLGPDGPWRLLGLGDPPLPRPGPHLPLSALVALGVALILFEGGLSLNLRDVRMAPRAVRNLITLGAAISLGGGALAAHHLAGLSWPAAWLFGAVIIVTGPTVILPLLRQVPVVRRVHSVLLWEGITIDAVGALTAAITLELVSERVHPGNLGLRLLSALVAGPALGALGGVLLGRLLAWRHRRGWADPETDPLVALAGGLGVYGLAEGLAPDAGLGAVTVAGLVAGNLLGPAGVAIRHFKGAITALVIAVLFLLLAANFPLRLLAGLWPFGWLAVAAVLLLVRPLSVALCARRDLANWRERLFVALIGPRGIVAASVASLCALILAEDGRQAEADGLLALTFATIIASVAFAGLGARPLSALLRVRARRDAGLMIVGADELALRLASLVESLGHAVVVVDRNPARIQQARTAGLSVAQGDALDLDFMAAQDLGGIGDLLAMTGNPEVDHDVATRIADTLGLHGHRVRLEAREVPDGTGRVLHVPATDLLALRQGLLTGRLMLRRRRPDAQGRLPPGFRPLLELRRDNVVPWQGEGADAAAELVGLEPADVSAGRDAASAGCGS